MSAEASADGQHHPRWLFSRATDLAAFGGSFILSIAALGLGRLVGIDDGETPGWAWVPAVVLCDVAHVWSTAFRTYLDPEARRRRRALLTAVPIAGLAASVALYALGSGTFWRALAYLAIFHFVRQQYGWVALYRARNGETARFGRTIDTAAIYAATLYPLYFWHTHVPRRFSWFVAGDVVALAPPAWFGTVALGAYVTALAAYALRALVRFARGTPNPGKDLVVATTAVAWYVGIVASDSDYAFTVTNVFMHGIPYFVLVDASRRGALRDGRAEIVATESAAMPASTATPASTASTGRLWRIGTFVGGLWLVAFLEELLWDRAIWHERAWLFGAGWDIGGLELVVVPLLALPQLTHYVVDGFIWRRRSNPSVARFVDDRSPYVVSTSSP